MRRSLQTVLTACVLCALFVPVAHGIPAVPGGCGQVTWEGECDVHDEVLTWCEKGQLIVANCDDIGLECGWSDSQGLYDCIEPSDPNDPCQGESFEGRCIGEVVIWCEDEVVYEADCGELQDLPGAQCGYNCDLGAYDCGEPANQVLSASMCSANGSGGGSVDLEGEDASGDSSGGGLPTGGTSGGCAVGGPGPGASWVLFGLLGLVLVGRTRRQRAG